MNAPLPTPNPQRVAIVIPLFNEEESVPVLAYKMRMVLVILTHTGAVEPRLYMVDDGSRDRTAALLEEAFRGNGAFRLVRHEKNRGFSQALRTGIQAALADDNDLIVTIDADTNYDHFFIPLLIEQFSPECDILTTSPWHPEGQRKFFPWHRLILSLGLSFLYRQVLKSYGQPLYTYSSCFRVARSEVYRRIQWTGESFLANSEILARCVINGIRVREIPFQVNPRWFGMSKMRKLRQIRLHLGLIWRLWRDPDSFRIAPPGRG